LDVFKIGDFIWTTGPPARWVRITNITTRVSPVINIFTYNGNIAINNIATTPFVGSEDNKHDAIMLHLRNWYDMDPSLFNDPLFQERMTAVLQQITYLRPVNGEYDERGFIEAVHVFQTTFPHLFTTMKTTDILSIFNTRKHKPKLSGLQLNGQKHKEL
jgi:hypothetical protein